MHSSPHHNNGDLYLLLSQSPASTIGGSVLSIGTYLSKLAGHATLSYSVSCLGLFSNLTDFFSYYLPDIVPHPVITRPCSNGIYIPVWMTKVEQRIENLVSVWKKWLEGCECIAVVSLNMDCMMGACHGDFSKETMSRLRPECMRRSLVGKSCKKENDTCQDFERERVWCIEDGGQWT